MTNVKSYLNWIKTTTNEGELLYIIKEVCLDWNDGYLSTGQAKGLVKRAIKEMKGNEVK